jgi:hypothetical protein
MAPSRVLRTRQDAATLRLALSSAASVASGYERNLRPSQSGVSRLARTNPTGGGR